MLHSTPQGLLNRLPCLISSPGHVPPIILPLQRNARGAISEAHWIDGMFDTACLTEQPSNKLRLHTLCHGVTVEGIVSWYHLRAVYGCVFIRVDTIRAGLGNRLLIIRAVVTGLRRVDPHDPLHRSPCIRLPLSGST